MACLATLQPIRLDFFKFLRRFVLSVLDFLRAPRQSLNIAVFENLAFSIKLANARVLRLRLRVHDAFAVESCSMLFDSMRVSTDLLLLLSQVLDRRVTMMVVRVMALCLRGFRLRVTTVVVATVVVSRTLGLRQVLYHVAHSVEEVVTLPVVCDRVRSVAHV